MFNQIVTFAYYSYTYMDQYRYFLHLAFDGSRFHGWQRQPNAATVQQTLEEAMTLLMRIPVVLTGAGRTDAGVHAADFYAHFDLDQPIDKPEREKLVFKLNRFLGGDIAISEILPVADQAHARFSAISRTYRYSIAREKNPFRRDYTHYFYGTIDDSLMNQGAALIMCYEDFTSFSNICRISAAKWTTEGSELVFTITADRFLRNMVRAIVGTLLELGTGKISLPGLKGIIEGNNRSDAGDSAPAKGLSLVRIVYPGEVFISERVDG